MANETPLIEIGALTITVDEALELAERIVAAIARNEGGSLLGPLSLGFAGALVRTVRALLRGDTPEPLETYEEALAAVLRTRA